MLRRPIKLACIISCIILGGCAVYAIETRGRKTDARALRRLNQRLGIYTAAVVLWPALLLSVLGPEPFTSPITATVVVVVLLYLSFEVVALSTFSGALSSYEGTEAVYERGVQVSTVAFAVATLLLSQKDDDLAALVAGPVLLALLFCTAAAVPSVVARRRYGASGHWNALQKIAVSFAAGLLCVSVARCLDELQNTNKLAIPLSRLRGDLSE